ncbi:hypothetical protein QAD02_011332 [Eretmocerus hayati]|uniref:Uncharacterized protein n=2 Tax=Eretmocerus hayati TaxID=131215 RepID=A0ACC2NWM3_9HYME|nr:hypothetical protein QAD02_004781 [Eretmocerus hayati]KAJ8675546.1 hypothetical protein QAD02_011332 [Eretmocerus hayati]
MQNFGNTEDGTSQTNSLSTVPEVDNTPQITLQTGVKRPLSSSGASTVSSIEQPRCDELPFTEVKKRTKKSKNEPISSPSTIVKQLEPAKDYIDSNSNILPMSYNKLLEFLESTQKKSKPDIAQLARVCCDDLDSLDNMLTNVYKFVSSRTLRSRLTRIKKSFSAPDDSLDNNNAQDEFSQDVFTDNESNTEDIAIEELPDHSHISPIINDGAAG